MELSSVQWLKRWCVGGGAVAGPQRVMRCSKQHANLLHIEGGAR